MSYPTVEFKPLTDEAWRNVFKAIANKRNMVIEDSFQWPYRDPRTGKRQRIWATGKEA